MNALKAVVGAYGFVGAISIIYFIGLGCGAHPCPMGKYFENPLTYLFLPSIISSLLILGVLTLFVRLMLGTPFIGGFILPIIIIMIIINTKLWILPIILKDKLKGKKEN